MIFAAGFGSRVSALSLVSYWISDSSKAELYAAIAVLENIGHAIGDPSMQQILAAAMRLPPFWLGIPFLVAAVSRSIRNSVLDFNYVFIMLTPCSPFILWREYPRHL